MHFRVCAFKSKLQRTLQEKCNVIVILFVVPLCLTYNRTVLEQLFESASHISKNLTNFPVPQFCTLYRKVSAHHPFGANSPLTDDALSFSNVSAVNFEIDFSITLTNVYALHPSLHCSFGHGARPEHCQRRDEL